MIDKKITKRNCSKNTLALLAVMVMLMATLLTACGSSKAADTSTKEDTTTVEVTKEAEPTEAEEVAEVEPAVEEPTAESTPEPVVYEGIDMESTLPGAEWIETFDGVIDEPKMVIFNDQTNKKVIVENGQEVEFTDTDTLAIFRPKEKECVASSLEDNFTFRKNSVGKNVKFYYDPTASLNNGDKVNVTQRLEIDKEEIVLTATLVFKKSE